MSVGDLSLYGEWLVQEVVGCTCYGGDLPYGHEPGCGYEPLVKVEELKAAFKAGGSAVVELPDCDAESHEWTDGGYSDPEWRAQARTGRVVIRVEQILYVDEARAFAAALLAAADAAEGMEGL